MPSIWEKAFGRFNHKRDLVRRLSEELIEYKDELAYRTIAETVISVGQNYAYAISLEHPRKIYILWEEAERLEVLDKAIARAIAEQDRPINDLHDNDDNTRFGLAKI